MSLGLLYQDWGPGREEGIKEMTEAGAGPG
jgi:hypothetical protein